MNLYELQDFFKNKHPELSIKMRFTDLCKKKYDISIIEGKPALCAHCVYDKVQVEVEGKEPVLISISPHRQEINWSDFKLICANWSEPSIPDSMLAQISRFDLESQKEAIKNISNISGLQESEIKTRYDNYKNSFSRSKEIDIIIE